MSRILLLSIISAVVATALSVFVVVYIHEQEDDLEVDDFLVSEFNDGDDKRILDNENKVTTQKFTEGFLSINSIPKGVDVYIDKKKVGKTPVLVDGIKSRTVVLTLDHPYYKKHVEKISLIDGEVVKKKIRLELAPAVLTVISSPEGADVYVDGEKQRDKTPSSYKIYAGNHKIEIKKDGYFPSASNVELKRGEKKVVRISLGGTDVVKIDGEYVERKELKSRMLKQTELEISQMIASRTNDFQQMLELMILRAGVGGTIKAEWIDYLAKVVAEKKLEDFAYKFLKKDNRSTRPVSHREGIKNAQKIFNDLKIEYRDTDCVDLVNQFVAESKYRSVGVVDAQQARKIFCAVIKDRKFVDLLKSKFITLLNAKIENKTHAILGLIFPKYNLHEKLSSAIELKKMYVDYLEDDASPGKVVWIEEEDDNCFKIAGGVWSGRNASDVLSKMRELAKMYNNSVCAKRIYRSANDLNKKLKIKHNIEHYLEKKRDYVELYSYLTKTKKAATQGINKIQNFDKCRHAIKHELSEGVGKQIGECQNFEILVKW